MPSQFLVVYQGRRNLQNSAVGVKKTHNLCQDSEMVWVEFQSPRCIVPISNYFLISPCSDSLNIINPRIESPTKPVIVSTEPNIIISFGTIVPANGWVGGAIWLGVNLGTNKVGYIKIKMPANSNITSIIKDMVSLFIYLIEITSVGYIKLIWINVPRLFYVLDSA